MLQIKNSSAVPTMFSVVLKNEKDGEAMYSVVVDTNRKTFSVDLVYKIEFTDEEASEGEHMISNGIVSGNIHLPLYIPLQDVKDVEQWEGITEAIAD